MLHAGLDLSRKRLDFHLLDERGETVEVGAAPPDADGLRSLAARLQRHGQPLRAAIESMTGARFVHDQLEHHGWEVEIADAVRVKGLAPLACKTDRIDAWVLAELSRRELVPAIWLPDPSVRAERERARFRLHLVRDRTSLKQRVHATLLTHGRPCPVADLFGVRGRALLAALELPEPWAGDVEASLRLIDELGREITACERQLQAAGAEHRYVPLLIKGPRYLRWALSEASTHASRHPAYRDRYQRTKLRLGKQRGPRVAQVDLARKLTEAIWHMLTRNRPFAPAGATPPMTA
jgi:transposase